MSNLSDEDVQKLVASASAHGALAEKMMDFQIEDRAFKKEIRDDMKALRRERSTLPTIAISVSIVALLISLAALVSTVSFQAKLSDEYQTRRTTAESYAAP
jgi:hypothetical protein